MSEIPQSFYQHDQPSGKVEVQIPTIERVEIFWWEKYANTPDFHVHVDEAWDFPSPYNTWPHRALFSDEHGTLYYAENEIWAHFVYDATKPGQQHTTHLDGQCTGELMLDNGSTIHVYNGWTSRASVVNKYIDDHVTEVTLYSSKFKSGRAGLAMKVDALRDILPDGVHIVEHDTLGDGEIAYYPSIDPNEIKKPR